ncbi:hypothetical protein ACFV0R_17140 [Streptomyces sp. NPDC059578]|uniref:hypothetical protein n=1 Tax=unclassified Streptomyces TaxID=2593676 RepID=UPI003666531C
MSIESNTRWIHVSTVPLAAVPEQHPAAFAESSNTGSPGATADFPDPGLPRPVRVQHPYAVDDTVPLVVGGRWRPLIDDPFATAGRAPEPGWSSTPARSQPAT